MRQFMFGGEVDQGRNFSRLLVNFSDLLVVKFTSNSNNPRLPELPKLLQCTVKFTWRSDRQTTHLFKANTLRTDLHRTHPATPALTMEPDMVTSESKITHIGAVCLSPCMEKVLMVQLKQAEKSAEWSFPYRADKKAAGQSTLGKEAAASAVQSLVGINVTHCIFLANPIEVSRES